MPLASAQTVATSETNQTDLEALTASWWNWAMQDPSPLEGSYTGGTKCDGNFVDGVFFLAGAASVTGAPRRAAQPPPPPSSGVPARGARTQGSGRRDRPRRVPPPGGSRRARSVPRLPRASCRPRRSLPCGCSRPIVGGVGGGSIYRMTHNRRPRPMGAGGPALLLPIFTRVRGRMILGTSSLGFSRKSVSSAHLGKKVPGVLCKRRGTLLRRGASLSIIGRGG